MTGTSEHCAGMGHLILVWASMHGSSKTAAIQVWKASVIVSTGHEYEVEAYAFIILNCEQ